MNNVPAVLPNFAQNMMPALPAELRDALLARMAPAMDTFGGSFNRISLKGSRFRLIISGQEVRQEPDALDFVILGISPDQYCVWYQNKYNGEEGIEPDAIWAMGEQPPANVPASVMVKDAEGRNQFSVRRRIVIAALALDAQGNRFVDLDNPLVWDMGGMSTFGNDISIGNFAFGKAYSFSNYMGLMKTHGMIPAACITKAVFDQSESVPVARFIPLVGQDGKIGMLDMGTLTKVVEVMQSQTVVDLLDWRRGAPAPQAAQQTSQQPAQQTVTQPQQTVQQQPVTTQQSVPQQTVQPQQVVSQPQQTVQQPDMTVALNPQQVADAMGGLDAMAAQMTQAVETQQAVPTQTVTQPQQTVQQQPQQAVSQPQQTVQQPAQQTATQPTQSVDTDMLAGALAGLMSDSNFA